MLKEIANKIIKNNKFLVPVVGPEGAPVLETKSKSPKAESLALVLL